MKRILLIPKIKVHNANALSSPYTIGFPAMTAWLGFMHKLQRQLNDKFTDLQFQAVAVVSHDIDLQTYKGESDYDAVFVAMAHPLKKMANDLPLSKKRAAI